MLCTIPTVKHGGGSIMMRERGAKIQENLVKSFFFKEEFAQMQIRLVAKTSLLSCR